MTEPKDNLLATAVIPGLPPTVNGIWRSRASSTKPHKTSAAQAWQDMASWYVRAGRTDEKTYRKHVKVNIVLCSVDNKLWDIDNRCKVLLDCLKGSGVVKDDSQVREMHVWRIKGERVETEISIFAI